MTSRHQRRRLAALLHDPRLEGAALLVRLRELRGLEGLAACSAAVEMLAHLSVPEWRAEQWLTRWIEHRATLARALGRDPGLVVAATDHLCNISRALDAPVIVEQSRLDRSERGRDPVTDLFDRSCFERRMSIEIRRSRRFDAEVSIATFDLDSFRPVNDVYGHAVGDRVLRRAGRVIRGSTRDSDIASRTGGDEFTVILPNTSRIGAFAAAQRVRQRLSAHFAERDVDGRLVAMTVSAGIACFPADGQTVEELLASVVRALQRVKARGGNEVVMHHSERRHAVRWPVQRSGDVAIALRPGGTVHVARAIDIAERGALIETRVACEPSQAVTMSLGSRPVPARVVRVDVRPGMDARRLALAFDRPLPPAVAERSARGGEG